MFDLTVQNHFTDFSLLLHVFRLTPFHIDKLNFEDVFFLHSGDPNEQFGTKNVLGSKVGQTGYQGNISVLLAA